jgi:Fur family ferric uptake transcriptional regulator
MLSEEAIVGRLRQAGYRITQPRRAVVRALLEEEGDLSPAEAQARASAHCPGIGLVTVYRTLDLLTEMGFARRIHSKSGCHSYAIASRGHRHHVVCHACGRTCEFEGCDLSAFLSRVSEETGYEIETHLLELVGLCPTCR